MDNAFDFESKDCGFEPRYALKSISFCFFSLDQSRIQLKRGMRPASFLHVSSYIL